VKEADALLARYISTITYAWKKDGTRRPCWDFRRLNALTHPDRYTLPDIDACLHLQQAKYFTKIDLKSAFWQIPMAEDSKAFTGFRVENKVYHWNRMPYGLVNAPATMQRLMDRMLGTTRGKYAYGYMDDIIIYSNSEGEHLAHVRDILWRIHKFGLRIGLSKCEFFTQEVTFLGHRISPGRLSIDPEKLEAIRKLKPPETVQKLQSLLGLLGYVRRFVMNYAAHAAPLTQCLRKPAGMIGELKPDTKIRWGKPQQEAFEVLIDMVTKAPVLIQPDFSKKFTLECDASHYGIGGVLMQDREINGATVRCPVSFYSRKLNPSEISYAVREKEMLAIKDTIEKNEDLLWGREFTVVTDHKSLIWVKTAGEDSGRLTRWVYRLSPFTFNIEYRPGKQNVVADALSRLEVFTLTKRQFAMRV
jgi:hypothetical protein